MACYRSGGCGPYEMYSCSECPASKPEYAQKQATCSAKQQVRLIDANTLTSALRHYQYPYGVEFLVSTQPTIDPESLRPQGEWVWKRRHHGGFRRYTGVDEFGNTHTITVDERSECDEPYCPNCGKWNESVFLNYCPNCGAYMKGAGEDG